MALLFSTDCYRRSYSEIRLISAAILRRAHSDLRVRQHCSDLGANLECRDGSLHSKSLNLFRNELKNPYRSCRRELPRSWRLGPSRLVCAATELTILTISPTRRMDNAREEICSLSEQGTTMP